MVDNKVAVITGAGRGIGNAIAAQLASEGYATAILDVLDENDIRENLDNVQKHGTPFIYFKGDITDAEDREDFSKKIMDQLGRIDACK